jgi:hypothetical protein
MTLGASEDFSPDELAILKALEIDGEQQAPGESQASEQQPATQTPAATAPANNATTTTEAGQPAAADTRPQGDVRAALRASRRAEQRAREEAERLKRENEELRSKVPASQQAPSDELTDEEIAQAERDFPLLGKTARFVKKAQAQQPAAAAPAAQPTGFEPKWLPPQVQEVVDGVPDLLAWQHDPDQGRFQLAIQVDTLLQSHPAWASKSFAERAQEVVRRVSAELPAQPAANRPDPAAVLAAVPRQTPDTLSHLGGGGGKQPEAPALQRYMGMSDDAIVADLLREG